jgi:hypothetical protein
MTKEILGSLIKAKVSNNGQLDAMGIKVGKLYTDHGLPIDMALDRLDITQEQKLIVLDGACQWLIKHKRNSGAAIDRQRAANRKMVENFITKGETGVY